MFTARYHKFQVAGRRGVPLCLVAAALFCLTTWLSAQDPEKTDVGQDSPGETADAPGVLGSGLDRILAEEMAEALAPQTSDDEDAPPTTDQDDPQVGLETVGGRLRETAAEAEATSGGEPEKASPPQPEAAGSEEFWKRSSPESQLLLFDDGGILAPPETDQLMPGEGLDLTPGSAITQGLGEDGDLPKLPEDPAQARAPRVVRESVSAPPRDPDAQWGLLPRGVLDQYRTYPLELALQEYGLFLPAEELEGYILEPLDPDGLTLLPEPLALPVRPDDYQVEPGWDNFLQDIEPPTPEERANERLVGIARKVAPAVLALRAWDEYGEELTAGCGFFISEDGLIMTDVQLVHPELADQIQYITARTGAGKTYRISGFWFADTANGFVVLQADARRTPHLPLKDVRNFPDLMEVAVLSLAEEKGLTLADARLSVDPFLSGQGWLRLTGNDSPGVPGSPVLNAQGEVIAIVALQVPEEKWLNFGLPAPDFAEVYDVLPVEPQPLSELASYRYNLANDSRFVAAVENLLARQYTMATRRLLRVVERYPRSAEAWGVLGLACSKMGATDEAINCHRRALAIDPDESQVWYQLSVNYLETENRDLATLKAAQAALQKTVDDRPADKLAWLLLAETWLRLQDYESAAEALSWIIRLEPDLPRIYYLLAVARGQLGEIDAAFEAVEQSLALNKNNPKAWFYLGLIHDSRKDFAEAARAYQETVDREPEHPRAWMNLAHALRRAGDMNPARRALRRHFEVEKKLAQRGKNDSQTQPTAVAERD